MVDVCLVHLGDTCIGRGQGLFCEKSAKVTNCSWVTDPFRWSWSVCEKFVVRGREF